MVPRLLLVSIGLLIQAQAHAGSVFVRAASEGQGTSITLGETCFIITPNHVMGKASSARLTIVDGTQLKADVVMRDEKLDLALLRLTDFVDRNMMRWCDLTTGVPLRTLETLATNRNALALILQRVSSTAGGLDSVSMRLQSADANSPWITLLPDSEKDRVFQGDSGSSIWSEQRYSNRSGESRGEMIGMVMSTEGESIRVLRSDHIYLAVHAMLWPLKKSLKFEPENVTLFEMTRGALCCNTDGRSRPQSIGWDDGFATVTFTLDLGDRDTVVSGVSATGVALAKLSLRNYFNMHHSAFDNAAVDSSIVVQTSSLRPGETKLWDDGCTTPPLQKIGGCRFERPRVIRGARVQFTGPVAKLTGITFATVRE